MAITDLFYLDAEGLHVPEYSQLLEYFQDEYKRIYGDDVNLDADSQDGEWVAVMALAMYDSMQVDALVYNSYSPASAIGDGLTRTVKINGLQRAIPSSSTVNLKCIGTYGTSISNGYAKDDLDRKWFLPTPTVIPISGEVVVTAVAEDEGALEAVIGSVNIIGTPQKGWASVNNEAVATAGDPVEADPDLRIRQSISTIGPSLTVFESVLAAVAAVPGIIKVKGYENDTAITDALGIPRNSISIVTEGGANQDIADAIQLKKGFCGTYGTTSVVVTDISGFTQPNTINFFLVATSPILIVVELTALDGWLTATADLIKASLAEYINSLNIGDDIWNSKLYCPANIADSGFGDTFNITAIKIDTVAGATPIVKDLVIAFNALATQDVANITVTVAP